MKTIKYKYYLIMPSIHEGKIIIWGFNMEKVNGTPIYWLGNAIGLLLSIIDYPIVQGILTSPAMNARDQLNLFFNQTITLPLSKNAAVQVVNHLNKMLAKEPQSYGTSGYHVLSVDDKSQLIGSILHFQSVFSAELPQMNIFFVNPNRAYDMTMLINNGELLLSQSTLNSLGTSRKEVVNDIKEAARCLAFGFATAVGFHLYRAIEAIIMDDYFSVLKVPSTDYIDNRNLGNYIKILIDKGVDVKITAMLKHLKDHYRNPIMHPNEFWDIDKANGAVGLAISVIEIMIQDIDEIKKKTTTVP
ncbi:MAG: hypothetical protein ACLQBQ_02040 [Smithella sp.]